MEIINNVREILVQSTFDFEGCETPFEVRRQFMNILEQGIIIDLNQEWISYKKFDFKRDYRACSSMKIKGEKDTFDLSLTHKASLKTDNSFLEVEEMGNRYGVSFLGKIKLVQDDGITKTIAFGGCAPYKTGILNINCKIDGEQTKDDRLVGDFNTQFELFSFEELAKVTNEYLSIKGFVLKR